MSWTTSWGSVLLPRGSQPGLGLPFTLLTSVEMLSLSSPFFLLLVTVLFDVCDWTLNVTSCNLGAETETSKGERSGRPRNSDSLV